MGAETEYAVTFLGKNGASLPAEVLMAGLLDAAQRSLRHLPDGSGRGFFATNGARFYIDCGCHPEYSTPEVEDPWQLVRYVEAGDRTLLHVARDFAERPGKVSDVVVFRNNADYSERTTWGSHESYLHGADSDTLARQIVPHLVTRIVYAGAGAFNPLSRGLEFTLSARAPHLVRVVSPSSTSERGLFHTKEESLCSGFRRLHLLCGDSVRSQTALWLAFGTTALVTAMADAGLGPGEAVQIRSPLSALRTISRDPDCRARVRLQAGGTATAVAIQRHYLSMAEEHVGHACMPPWAGDVCARWRSVLEALERTPFDLVGVLEWPTRLALYREFAQREGISWGELKAWNRVLGHLPREAPPAEPRGRGHVVARLLWDLTQPLSIEIEEPRPRKALTPERNEALERFLRLRRRLLETDTRWGQIGQGVFARLEDAGLLRHRVDGVEDVDKAMTEPPPSGRARLRGDKVRELADAKPVGSHACAWDGIYRDSRSETMRFDLSDPFATEATWQPWSPIPFALPQFDRRMVSFLDQLGL